MNEDGEGQGFDPSHSGDTKKIYPERFGEVLEYENIAKSPKALKRMYEVGIEKGYITEESIKIFLEGMSNFYKNKLLKLLEEKGLSFETFYEIVQNAPRTDTSGVEANIAGLVDKEIISETATFGVNEPTYFELLGADINKLREVANPRFLLLGSLGHYSAEEFRIFADKINSGAIVSLVDNSRRYKEMMEKRFSGTDINFVSSDVREMPFEDGSQDLVASDYLLRSFRDERNSMAINEENFLKLFQEVFRILKPGGSYILMDMPENLTGLGKTKDEFQEKIAKIASLAGLKLVGFSDGFSYPLRKDVSSTEIGEDGKPKYKNLVAHDFYGRGFKFVKP